MPVPLEAVCRLEIARFSFAIVGNGPNRDIQIGLRAMGLTTTIDNLFGLNLCRRILRYLSHLNIGFRNLSSGDRCTEQLQ
jgi:hypothetical protein